MLTLLDAKSIYQVKALRDIGLECLVVDQAGDVGGVRLSIYA